MRLYLSSYRWGDDVERLRVPAGTGRAAVVLNALDHFGEGRTRDWELHRSGLEALGHQTAELDLRRWFGEEQALAEHLSGLDLVWVVGGNAFVLARAVAAAGLAPALRRRAAEGPFTYGGYSAGACVTGPDLTGVDAVDDPQARGVGHPRDVEPVTLGLVPFRIVPHWESDHPETELVRGMASVLRQRGLEHRLLRDGEVVVTEV